MKRTRTTLDFIREIAGDQAAATRFTQETTSISDFTSMVTPTSFNIQAVRTQTPTISGSMPNARPMVISMVLDVSATPVDDLIMLVNPSDLSVAATKVVTERFTRGGWHVDKWGDELDTISASGTTGAFFIPNIGLTHFYRQDSAAMQNLYAMLLYYKVNGRTFLQNFNEIVNTASLATSQQGVLNLQRIKAVGAVKISYGATNYIGTFDSLQIQDKADNPYRMTYSFEFKVHKTVFTTGSAYQSNISPEVLQGAIRAASLFGGLVVTTQEDSVLKRDGEY